MIKLAVSLVLLISIPSLIAAQPVAQIVEGAKAEKEVQGFYANEVGVSVGRTDVVLANERLRKLRYGGIDWPVYLEKLQHNQDEWRKTMKPH